MRSLLGFDCRPAVPYVHGGIRTFSEYLLDSLHGGRNDFGVHQRPSVTVELAENMAYHLAAVVAVASDPDLQPNEILCP